MGVVVPAHDEEDGIVATMTSVTAAARTTGIPVEAVVVLDSCSDGTARLVQHRMDDDDAVVWAGVESSCRRASSSRDVGVASMVRSFSSRPAGRVAILSTDADTVVPVDWIVRHVRLLEAGHDAVAGVVDIDPATAVGWHESWQREYTHAFGPGATHPHVHSANLSVRLDALVAAGGFGDLARAEDIDLWRRLRAVGARLLSDRTSVVRTSSRRDGRVDGGFATALRRFAPPLGDAPDDGGRIELVG